MLTCIFEKRCESRLLPLHPVAKPVAFTCPLKNNRPFRVSDAFALQSQLVTAFGFRCPQIDDLCVAPTLCFRFCPFEPLCPRFSNRLVDRRVDGGGRKDHRYPRVKDEVEVTRAEPLDHSLAVGGFIEIARPQYAPAIWIIPVDDQHRATARDVRDDGEGALLDMNNGGFAGKGFMAAERATREHISIYGRVFIMTRANLPFTRRLSNEKACTRKIRPD